MLASHRHGFVFLKARKTAGTTIETALAPHLGPEDVITPCGATGELLRADAGCPAPRNFCDSPELEERYRQAIADRDKATLVALRRQHSQDAAWGSHINAARTRAWVGEELWQRALKFTAERHPYEKALSLAHFQYRGDGSDLAEHIDHTVRHGKYLGFGVYAIGDEPVLDEVIRFDTLEEDVRRIWERLGLPAAALPEIRRSERGDRGLAEQRLTPEQKDVVYRRCRREFELFGWER